MHAGSCLKALSEAFLPLVLEEGSGSSGRRATGKTEDVLARVELAFKHFTTSVDPVSSKPLYTAETYALHERQLENIRNHQLTGRLPLIGFFPF